MDYEKNLEKLENIVKLLENEKLNIEESLKLYDEGITRAKACIKDLNNMKGKFELLNKDLEEIEIENED